MVKLPFLKKKEIEIPEKVFEAEEITVLDIIAPAGIEVSPNYIRLGERLAKSFFIFSFPRYISSGWLSPVINLETPIDISLFVHPVETGLVLKQLRKKVTEVQSEIMEKEEKGLVRDPALEAAYRNLEELRDKLQSAQERMFKFGLYLTIYGDSEKELREIENILRSIFEARLIYLRPALFRQRDGFISTSPSGLDLIGAYTPMNTEPLSSCFPFISFDLSSNEGILYGINRHNNSLILFDRFTLENSNEVLFGKAGSGKSLKGDEPVLIKNKWQIQLVKIGPLVENLIKNHGATQIDEELEGVINPEVEVYSFNKDLKGGWSKVTIAARKKAPDSFYKFITKSGRQIQTTEDHNLIILKNGRVMIAKSSEIKEGEYIPLPRSIAKTQESLNSLNLLYLFRNSEKVYVLGAKDLIRDNSRKLKKAEINNHFDCYLYKYREGRVIPIKYFWEILDYLKIKLGDERLKELKVVSKNGDRKNALDINLLITPEFLRLAGYILAEGTVREDVIMITNNDPGVLSDIDYSLKKLKVPFFYGNRGIVIASRLFIETIKALGGRGSSEEKKVWPLIFNLGKEKIAQYLSTYFEGDGGVEKDRLTIAATSKSKRLISEIAYLLLYFGIIGRISKTKKKATNSNWKRKRTYWRVTISGQDNLRKFAENINFASTRKRKNLAKIIKKEGNTNVDVIPGLSNIFQEIYQLFGAQLHGISEISEWKRSKRNPSPEHLKRIIKKIEERIQYFRDLASTFKVLSELPELATIIDLGWQKKKLNRALWKTLGGSWGLMKKREVKPKSINVLKALNIINGNNCSLKEIKEALHFGFQEMNLPIKYFNRSLQPQLANRVKENTNYQTIQRAAQYVWQNYQEILEKNIPQVEKKLNQLKILANSDLFWDPIVKIEKIQNKKEKYVYDLTVDNEVFLAGQGGMFVHNSYCVKLETLRYLMQGVDCIIIDPEHEYEFLSDAVGGSYFKMSLTSPHHLNPFDLPTPREDERSEDVLRSNIINLVGLLRIMLGGLTPEEDAIIDTALTETYAAKDITPETDPQTWRERIPLMSDLEAVLETMVGAESLVRRIRKFTRGTYASFFNQYSNVSMENQFVCFGIRDMEEELRPMAMFIILRYIWNQVRSRLKKRILVVDEAWHLMQTPDGASFLFGTAKRARKYWLGVTTITQDVSDFMKSEYGQPIVANSSLQILMKQSPATIDIVQKIFNLTEEEKYLLLEAAVGEGLFFAGQKHVAMKVVASYGEDQLITTAPEEVLKIKRAKEELIKTQKKST